MFTDDVLRFCGGENVVFETSVQSSRLFLSSPSHRPTPTPDTLHILSNLLPHFSLKQGVATVLFASHASRPTELELTAPVL